MKLNINLNKEKREEETKDESFINYHILNLEVDGKEYSFDVGPLISLSNKNLEYLSIEELENALEKTSSYRFSISTLKEKVNEKLSQFKEEFDKWQAENWFLATSIAVKRRKQIKDEENVPNNWFGSITKEEVRGLLAIAEDTKKEFQRLNHLIRKYDSAYNQLTNLLSILEDRGSQLQSIMRNRGNKKFI